MKPIFILMLAGAGLINAAGSTVMKYASTLKTPGSPGRLSYWLLMLLAMSLYGGCFPLFAAALARTRLSAAQPIFSAASYIAVTAAAMLFFHEAFSPLKIAGLAVIVIGIVMVAR